MNNNMPNNNTNGNNNDLNAVSLGNIEMGNNNPIPPVPPVDTNPVEPVSTIPTVDASNVEPVSPVSPVEPVAPAAQESSIPPVNPVPPVENTIPDVNAIPPVQPVNYDIPETINNFNPTPVFNEIGTVPPIPDTPIINQAPVNNTQVPEPKKKKGNKLIFVIIIVLLIAAVGVGVYIFLNVSNKPAPVSVTPKAVEIEAGSEVSTNIADYADFSGINSANCTLDTSSITDVNSVGSEYPFTITCGASTYNGTATIVDTTAPVSVTPKAVEIEAGSEVSTNIADYADFSGINSANCTLDTSSITDVNSVGSEYPFTITCGASTYNGTATIVDTTAPVAVLSPVTVQVGGTVSAEDFVSSCNDVSGCSYSFANEETVKGYLNTAGNYHVDINIKDGAGNQITSEGTLVVTTEEVAEVPDADMYLSCANAEETLRFGIVTSNFNGYATRSYEFTLSESEYNTFKSANENSSSVTYNNVTGAPTFDDDTHTLTITQVLSDDEVADLPTSYGELRSQYVGDGYTCTLEQP